MFDSLSTIQQEIVFNKSGKFVVKACPGSGKTFSVAARIARLLSDDSIDFSREGIAAMSFTNVAWREIENTLEKKFSVKSGLKFPHFLGTIDRFINQYIFLPYGHLVLECDKRPEMVGEPHRPWTMKSYERDPSSYFDKISFDVNDELIPIVPKIGFTWNNNDGSRHGQANNIETRKWELLKEGYANQSDANYFAMKILQKYPLVGMALAKRFKYLIIDEAQDSTAVQNAVIDLLIYYGIREVMIIGDPDQAIYEWNTASPQLFEQRFIDWESNSIILSENRRSSIAICEFTQHLSGGEKSESINEEVRDFGVTPQIHGYNDADVLTIVNNFLQHCTDNGVAVNDKDVQILYRSSNFIEHLGIPTVDTFNSSPWKDGNVFTKEIIHGKILIERGMNKNGFRRIENGFWCAMKNLKFCRQSVIEEILSERFFQSMDSRSTGRGCTNLLIGCRT